jgi:hypothetical protein
MQNAPQSAAAVRDRAERHVFGELADLEAVDRRVLALLELAQGDRALAVRETGLDDEAVRHAAARGRKALRRRRAPLPSGARCERSELLLSDGLDGSLDWRDRRWLDIHVDRCARCREHETLLEAARAELRESFAAGETEFEQAPPPPAEEAAPPDERAHLRVVPPAAPEPPPEPAGEIVPAAPSPAVAERAPRRGLDPARRAALARTARVLAAVLVVAAVLAAIALGIIALAGHHHDQSAPWDGPDAPVVHPAPLSGQ